MSEITESLSSILLPLFTLETKIIEITGYFPFTQITEDVTARMERARSRKSWFSLLLRIGALVVLFRILLANPSTERNGKGVKVKDKDHSLLVSLP